MGNWPNRLSKCIPPLFEKTYQMLLNTEPPGGLASLCVSYNLNSPGWSPVWNLFAQEEQLSDPKRKTTFI